MFVYIFYFISQINFLKISLAYINNVFSSHYLRQNNPEKVAQLLKELFAIIFFCAVYEVLSFLLGTLTTMK